MTEHCKPTAGSSQTGVDADTGPLSGDPLWPEEHSSRWASPIEMFQQGQAQERRRITRELHDSTMQLLSCLSLALGRLKRPLRSTRKTELILEMESLLGDAQSELRTLSYLAHPPLLEEVGLRQALETLLQGFGRRCGLNTSLHWNGEFADSVDAIEVVVYRVVQEALSNVHRHARAANVAVILTTGVGVTEVKIADDGVGMPLRPIHGVGLCGMKARLEELGGTLTLRSACPGTEVVATIPQQWQDPAMPEFTF